MEDILNNSFSNNIRRVSLNDIAEEINIIRESSRTLTLLIDPEITKKQ